MRWTPGGRSPNLEDRRGRGFGGPLGIGGGIVTLILALIFGPGIITDGGETTGSSYGDVGLSPADSAAEEPMVQFVSFVLDDAQQTWRRIFAARGDTYQDAKLVLFRDAIDSGCGFAQVAAFVYASSPKDGG